MAELWELICHHTYKGMPGVIVDRSPLRASHGRAWNLDNSDFLADGAALGSGAVSFYKQGGSVHVPTEADAWQWICGVRGEVTLRRESSDPGIFIDSIPFSFGTRFGNLIAWFRSSPTQPHSIDTIGTEGEFPPYRVPFGRWVTLGFMYDGFGTMELHAEGRVVRRLHVTFPQLAVPGPSGLSIGHGAGPELMDYSALSRIDDVKIWRLNPRFMEEEFFARPMDAKTAECWRRFLDEIEAASRRHPDCARELGVSLRGTLGKLIGEANAKGPETKAQLKKSALEYNKLWRAGRIDGVEMKKVFADLIAWLRLVGLDPATNPALRRFADSECLRLILSEIKPPDCDKQAIRLLQSIIESLGGSAPDKPAKSGKEAR